MILKPLFIALALVVASVSFATSQEASQEASQETSALSDLDRATLRSEIRMYLLENPELILEVIQVLESQQQEQAGQNDIALVQTNAAELYDDGISYVGGNPDGDITIVEFLDYRCGYCRRAFDEVEALVKRDGNIRFVVKEYPILGEQSDLASRLAVAVLQVVGPDAYKEAHDLLMTTSGNLTPSAAAQLLAKLDVDVAAVIAHTNSDQVSAHIGSVRALGQRLQISGTPTFVIEDQLVRGYIPGDQMAALIAELRG